jgi:hypothetical protein
MASKVAFRSASRASADPWIDAMRHGDFERAWRLSDAHLSQRIACGAPTHAGPRHLQHIWNGESLDDKRVLVRCYHGLGDSVQFLRFIAPLRARAQHVALWIQPQLVDLASRVAGVDRAMPLHDGVPDVAFDVDIEIMELGHALRVDENAIRCPVPYLHPRLTPFGLLKPPNLRAVGLVWQAGDWDSCRSIPAPLLSALTRVSGIRLFSLQRGWARDGAAHIPAQDIGCDDIERTASTLRQLDLLITVDTFIAHFAGALGVPVWLLLHSQSDWRWMEGRTDTPWYPTMRLFRQTRPGDWTSVVNVVAEALSRQWSR